MAASWGEGNWLCRWAPHIAGGYGYPVFNYYAPLFSYLGAALASLMPLLSAFNIAVFLVFTLAGFGMYLFALELWPRPAAFTAAVLYLAAPYHLLELYVRGTTAELTAYAVFPFVLWAIRAALLRDGRRWSFMAIGIFAGFFLAHNISMMVFFPVSLLYLFLCWHMECRHDGRGRALGRGIAVIISAMLLTAFFWLPAVLETGLVHIHNAESSKAFIRDAFIALPSLVFSSWGDGVKTSMGLMIGPLWLAVFLAGAWYLLLFSGRSSRLRWNALFFLGLFASTCFLTTAFSNFLWDHVSALHLVQQPYRFLAFVFLALSVLAAGAVMLVHERHQGILAGLITACVLVSVFSYARPFRYEQGGFPLLYTQIKQLPPMDTMEFLPAFATPMKGVTPKEKLVLLKGAAVPIALGDRNAVDHHYAVDLSTPSVFIFLTYYFEGWRVLLDGRDVPIQYKNTPGGIMSFVLPAGKHDLRIVFRDTPVRAVANAISLAAAGLLFMLAFLFLFKVPGAWRPR